MTFGRGEKCAAPQTKRDALWSRGRCRKTRLADVKLHREQSAGWQLNPNRETRREIPEKGRRRSRDAALICVSGQTSDCRVVRAIDTRALAGGDNWERPRTGQPAGVWPECGKRRECALNWDHVSQHQLRTAKTRTHLKFKNAHGCLAGCTSISIIWREKSFAASHAWEEQSRRELLARTCCLRHRNCKRKQQKRSEEKLFVVCAMDKSFSLCQQRLGFPPRNKFRGETKNIKIISQKDK